MPGGFANLPNEELSSHWRFWAHATPAFRAFERTMSNYGFLVVIIGVATVSALALRNQILIGPFQSADLLPPYLDWSQLSSTTLSGWSFQGNGGPNGASYLLVGMGFVVAATHSAVFAEELFYYPSICASGLFAFLFLRYLGIDRRVVPALSIGYTLCPWFTGQFFSGEPGLVWAFALLPLYLFVVFRVVFEPARLLNYLALSCVWVLALIATFQSLAIFLPFTISPFMLLLYTSRYRTSLKACLGWVLATGAAVVTQTVAIQAYFTGASLFGLSSSSGSDIFQNFGFYSPEAIQIGSLILVFAGLTAFILLLKPKQANRRTELLILSQFAVAIAFGALYFGVPSPASLWIFDHTIILWPYLDFDKFLLLAWVSGFLTLSFCLPLEQDSRLTNLRGDSHEKTNESSTKEPVWRYSGISSVRVAVVCALAMVLVISALIVPIQVLPNPPNGSTFLEGDLPFSERQIPPYYFDLRAYLLAHGASFGFGPRTLMVPQNPGAIDPFYIGEYLDPGFLIPSPSLQAVVSGIIQNDSSDTSELLALMGVEWLVVAPQVPDPTWPSLASGPVSLGSLGSSGALGNAWFPQGSPSAYAKTVDSWPTLRMVYSSENLTILQNKQYVGPAISTLDPGAVSQIASGNYDVLYNQTPIGPNVVRNSNLSGRGQGWSIVEGANASLLANGTIELNEGSEGARVSQPVTLLASTRYNLSFQLETSPGYLGSPPEGATSTYIGVYWNPGTGFNSSGAFITKPYYGNYSGAASYEFDTPPSASKVTALLILNAEPPDGTSPIYTTFSHVSLIPVNGGNLSRELFQSVSIKAEGPTSFRITGNHTSAYSSIITLDTGFGEGWVADLSSGEAISGVSGLFDQLSFDVPSNQTVVTIAYGGQTTFVVLELGGLVGVASLIIAFLVWAALEDARRRRMPPSSLMVRVEGGFSPELYRKPQTGDTETGGATPARSESQWCSKKS
jgi:hypothetical protein